YASWYAHVPGLKVVAPYTGADHKGLLKSAIRDPNPVIFLEHELVYGESFAVPDDPEFLVPIGKARIARAGEHVTITAFSRMVKLALQAAEELEKAGISAEVIDLRSLRPFDVAAVAESVKKSNRIVAAEEGMPPTVTEGSAARGQKKDGDAVNAGDVLAEIETDKATMEYEAADEGRIGKIIVPEAAQAINQHEPITLFPEEGAEPAPLNKFG